MDHLHSPKSHLGWSHVTLETTVVSWRNMWMTQRCLYWHGLAGKHKSNNARDATAKSQQEDEMRRGRGPRIKATRKLKHSWESNVTANTQMQVENPTKLTQSKMLPLFPSQGLCTSAPSATTPLHQIPGQGRLPLSIQRSPPMLLPWRGSLTSLFKPEPPLVICHQKWSSFLFSSVSEIIFFPWVASVFPWWQCHLRDARDLVGLTQNCVPTAENCSWYVGGKR